MLRYIIYKFVVYLPLIIFSASAWSFTMETVADENVNIDDYSYVIPYLYYTESTEAVVGGIFFSEGLFQPQLNISATAYTSANDSNGVWLEVNDLKLANRVGLNLQAYSQRWTKLKIYSDSPQLSSSVTGNRDSSAEQFLLSHGRESVIDISTFFVLPVGNAKQQAIHEYILDSGGILDDSTASGGKIWDPRYSGRSIITSGLISNTLAFDDDAQQGTYQRSLAAYLGLEYDNTDYFRNPTYGSRQSFLVKHDWGGEHSDVPWTTLELDLAKYINLGKTSWSRQQLIALNAWIKNTPSWDKKQGDLYQRPPIYQRAGLGGLDRMRAYTTQRFNDKSALYYSAEYRITPQNNIFSDLGFLDSLVKVRWVQLVVFAEVGQVNDSFNFTDLHRDMKWDTGFGIRGLVNGIIVRMDAAYSDEGGALSVFFGHTF